MHIQRVIRLAEESTKQRYLDSDIICAWPHFDQKYIVKEFYMTGTLFLVFLHRVCKITIVYFSFYTIFELLIGLMKNETRRTKIANTSKTLQFFCPQLLQC